MSIFDPNPCRFTWTDGDVEPDEGVHEHTCRFDEMHRGECECRDDGAVPSADLIPAPRRSSVYESVRKPRHSCHPRNLGDDCASCPGCRSLAYARGLDL